MAQKRVRALLPVPSQSADHVLASNMGGSILERALRQTKTDLHSFLAAPHSGAG